MRSASILVCGFFLSFCTPEQPPPNVTQGTGPAGTTSESTATSTTTNPVVDTAVVIGTEDDPTQWTTGLTSTSTWDHDDSQGFIPTTTATPPECNDGELEGVEYCDTDAFGPFADCAALTDGEKVGPLICDSVCGLDQSLCKDNVCGDGVVFSVENRGTEECDNGGENGPGKACNAMCKFNICGDGDPGPNEACDDGNMMDGDGCSAQCQLRSPG